MDHPTTARTPTRSAPSPLAEAASVAEYWAEVEAINFPEIVVAVADDDLMITCLVWQKYVRQPANADSCLID